MVEEDKKKCPLCHNELKQIEDISVSFNGLCEGCARTTYIVWRDMVEKSTIEGKLDKLLAYIIPNRKDNSKLLQEIAKLVVKGKPPRKQPKKHEPIRALMG